MSDAPITVERAIYALQQYESHALPSDHEVHPRLTVGLIRDLLAALRELQEARKAIKEAGHLGDDLAQGIKGLRDLFDAKRKDAQRYRWLRAHCRFANDSLQELWFDRSISDGEQSALDKSIDAELAQLPSA